MAFASRLRLSRQERRNLGKGLLFASPWIVGFVVLMLYPFAASLYFSFMRYDALRPPRFIGLTNYKNMLFNDEIFRVVMGNTLYFVIIGVPAGVITAFLLAVLLNQEIKFRPVFRTVFFLPFLAKRIFTDKQRSSKLSKMYMLLNYKRIIDSFGV